MSLVLLKFDFRTESRSIGSNYKPQRDFNPYAGMDDNEHDIADNQCNPWVVTLPKDQKNPDDFSWGPQVTVPMPLEALHDIFGVMAGQGSSELVVEGRNARKDRHVYVTGDFFQANPNGLSKDNVKASVLGFLSLLVTFAKLPKTAPGHESSDSYKQDISILPRTDFTSIYNNIKQDIEMQGSLLDLVKILACYSNQNNGADVK